MSASRQDIDLILQLRKGDEKAFSQVYTQYFDMARYFILKNNGTFQEAKDVFQDAIIILHEKSVQNDFELTCALKTFLYSIIRNLWLKQLKEKSKNARVQDFEEFIPVENDSYDNSFDEKIDLVVNQLANLGEKCQKLLTGFYFYKKKMSVLAVELGYTNAANAKNQKYKCLQQLKKRVREN